MSKSPKNPYADTEFVRAYHIERRECEAAYNVHWTTEITTATRPDRVVIRLSATMCNAPEAHPEPLCSYTREWPNEQAVSFSAALFNAGVQLTRLVEDSLRDIWAPTLRPGRRG